MKVEVLLIRWPEEAEEGAGMVVAGVPVLYLVGHHDDLPVPTSCLEDWLLMPFAERELIARKTALELRAGAHDAKPRIDTSGRFHYQGRTIDLAPPEARLAHLLTQGFGNLVSDQELIQALDHVDGPGTYSLRATMTHLRSGLRGLGLTLSRIRGHGYKLQSR